MVDRLQSFRSHCREDGHQILRLALCRTEKAESAAQALKWLDTLIESRDAHQVRVPRRLPSGWGIDDITDRLREARKVLTGEAT